MTGKPSGKPKYPPRVRTRTRDDLAAARTKMCAIRGAQGFTQKQLAEKADIPLRTYRAIERDEVFDPGIRQLVRIAQALQVQLVEVLEPKWMNGTHEPISGRRRGRS